MDPLTILSLLKGAAKHWRLVVVTALAAAVVVLLTWNVMLRRDRDSWELRAQTNADQSKNATEQAHRAEEGRQKLKAAIAEYMERAKENERRLEASRQRIAELQHAAHVAAERTRREAEGRIAELEKRLEGLDECQRCREVLAWLDEEVGW